MTAKFLHIFLRQYAIDCNEQTSRSLTDLEQTCIHCAPVYLTIISELLVSRDLDSI